ncbi:hypothetical protein M5F66_01080, partial [Acinetobacter sp. ANC 5033]|nr:hypothetical protein [Acinetobacter amyesii]
NAGWNVTGSSANSANIGPNGKLDVKGSNNNLTVSQTGKDQDAVLEIALADDLNVDSVTAGNTVVNGDGLSFTDTNGKATGPSIAS